MNHSTLCRNLRRFRLAKGHTQEQAAELLGVSPQAVSRWECGVTLPDAALLPDIARLYCVTIDDLYREAPMAYGNYARRLAAVYEADPTAENFARADTEFRKLLDGGEADSQDLHYYAGMCCAMMNACRHRALRLWDQVLAAGAGPDPESYWAARQSKLLLRVQQGQGDKCVAEQLALAEQEGAEAEEWVCLLAACQYADRMEDAYRYFRRAAERFPECAMLHVRGGDVCKALGKIDEALEAWDRATALDCRYHDAEFSKGFYYEETGEYAAACALWSRLADQLERDGLDIAAALPRELAGRCREKMREAKASAD